MDHFLCSFCNNLPGKCAILGKNHFLKNICIQKGDHTKQVYTLFYKVFTTFFFGIFDTSICLHLFEKNVQHRSILDIKPCFLKKGQSKRSSVAAHLPNLQTRVAAGKEHPQIVKGTSKLNREQ